MTRLPPHRLRRRPRRRAGPVVALRADLDALPVEDPPATRGPAPSRASRTPAATTCTPPRWSAPASRWPRRTTAACCRAGSGCSSSRPRRSCPAARCDLIERGRARRASSADLRAALRPRRRRRAGRAAGRAADQRRGPRSRSGCSGTGGHTAAPAPDRRPDLRAGQGDHRAARRCCRRRLDPRAGVSVVWGSVHAGAARQRDPDRGEVAGTVRILDAVAWADCEELVRDLVHEIVAPYGVDGRGRLPARRPAGASTTPARTGSWPRRSHAVARRRRPGLGTTQSLGGEDFGWYLDTGARGDGPARHPHARRPDVRPAPGQPARRRARDRRSGRRCWRNVARRTPWSPTGNNSAHHRACRDGLAVARTRVARSAPDMAAPTETRSASCVVRARLLPWPSSRPWR